MNPVDYEENIVALNHPCCPSMVSKGLLTAFRYWNLTQSGLITNYDLRNTFQTERNLLLFAGFYPLRSKNRYYGLYVFSKCFNYFFAYSQFFTMVIEIAMGIDDVSKLTETLLYFMTHGTFLWKLANFTYRHQKILEMEDQLADPQFYGFPDEQLRAFKEKVKSCVFIGNIYRVTCVMGITFFTLVPHLDENKYMALPLPGWFPGNYTDYYSLAFGYQIVSLYAGAFSNSTIDILAWVMITVAAAQFDVLKQNLMNICYRHGRGRVQDDKVLRKCVELHMAILRYVENIEGTFSNGMFLQFFASVVIICVTLFQMIFEPFGTVRFQWLVCYMNCMLCQVAMYCWYGHDLTLTSDAIGRDFYMSNWYESDVRVRKNMVIFLERIKRPVVLTAGNFVPLSLGTLTTILRSSYSYFAVLQRLYSEK